MERRTIEVRGRATVTAPADITVVKAKVSGVAKTFEDAMRDLADITASLRDAVEDAGIPRKDLKTSELCVERHYKKVKDGKDRNGYDQYKSVPDGFEYRQRISFEFPNDNDKLSRSVSNITKCRIEPNIVFFFRNSDPEKMRREAIAKAAANARSEAEIILGAVGERLGKLISVDREIRYYNDDDDDNGICCCKPAPSEDLRIDVEPEDEEFDQNVTMVWEIADRLDA